MIICPICNRKLLNGVAKSIEEHGYEIYCPDCKRFSHIKGTMEVKKKKKEEIILYGKSNMKVVTKSLF